MWFSGTRIYAEQVKRAKGARSIFVELGAWKGRSTAFMGVEIANSGKDIEFYSIDHWHGSLEEIPHRVDEDVRLGRLYEVYLENIRCVKDYVKPIRSDSTEAAQQFADQSVDFVYVDAGHTYTAVARDIAAWWPKVRLGGVLAGDDWCTRSVRTAITDFFTPSGTDIVIQPGCPNPEWEQWLIYK
jgi:predicted O-methyltransferase YrrM